MKFKPLLNPTFDMTVKKYLDADTPDTRDTAQPPPWYAGKIEGMKIYDEYYDAKTTERDQQLKGIEDYISRSK